MMWYQVALLCDTERGVVWMWLSRPMSDPMEAQMFIDYCKCLYPSNLIGYAEANTVEGLERWLKERNAPTDRTSLPEESGPGGDKDTLYVFTVPESWQEQQAWLQLARKYRDRELES